MSSDCEIHNNQTSGLIRRGPEREFCCACKFNRLLPVFLTSPCTPSLPCHGHIVHYTDSDRASGVINHFSLLLLLCGGSFHPNNIVTHTQKPHLFIHTYIYTHTNTFVFIVHVFQVSTSLCTWYVLYLYV